MTDEERVMIDSIIVERSEVAYKRLKNNKRYNEIRERQKKTETKMNELLLLHHMDEKDRLSIRQHYEGEVERGTYERAEIYIQGLMDCAKILTLLGVFNLEL